MRLVTRCRRRQLRAVRELVGTASIPTYGDAAAAPCVHIGTVYGHLLRIPEASSRALRRGHDRAPSATRGAPRRRSPGPRSARRNGREVGRTPLLPSLRDVAVVVAGTSIIVYRADVVTSQLVVKGFPHLKFPVQRVFLPPKIPPAHAHRCRAGGRGAQVAGPGCPGESCT